jgi:hypothetical protein
MRIIKYIVVAGEALDQFRCRVNNRIKKGYEPYGSMSLTMKQELTYSYPIFLQPMVLRQCDHLIFVNKETCSGVYDRVCAACGEQQIIKEQTK